MSYVWHINRENNITYDKFDETVEVRLRLAASPKHAVRTVWSFPRS